MAVDRCKLMGEAKETVAALDAGGYAVAGGWVDLRPALEHMRSGTRLYTPADLDALPAQAGANPTRLAVTRETTLSAVKRLLAEDSPVAALNFASGSQAGGGFLAGAAAQEESLARASGLYASLRDVPAFYAPAHRNHHRYSDHLIFSPQVPVFRSEEGDWLPQPYSVDLLTAAAPNLRFLEGEALARAQQQVAPLLEARLLKIMKLFQARGCRRLVLGAWGCGAYRNDPVLVADLFAMLLEGPLAGAFEQVVFAVFAMPWEEGNLRAFQQRFAPSQPAGG